MTANRAALLSCALALASACAVRGGAVLIDEDVTAAHTATVNDAFVGATRLKLANEGSARKNIAALIERLKQIRVAVPAAPST